MSDNLPTIALRGFLDEYGQSMAAKVARELEVIHDPLNQPEPELAGHLESLSKKPFPAQAEIIKAGFKSLVSGNRSVYLVAECGSGKTLMAIATAWLLHKLENTRRVLVICPPHLVRKWIQEVKEALPRAKALNLNGRDVIKRLERIGKEPKPKTLEFHIIGRERAKTGFIWRPAVIQKQGLLHCPRCGRELLDQDGLPLPVFERNAQGRYRRKYACNKCAEPLWQADGSRPQYRRAMPARFIKGRMKGVYDLLVADEVHQFKNTSGQGYAFGVLARSCKYTVCLTGTLAGGYASDVFRLLFRTHAQDLLADGLSWSNPKGFIERYGVLERITTVRREDGLTTRASKRNLVKEKPGLSPLLLGKMLLPNSVFLRLSDCMADLQPYEEDVVELAMPPAMAGLYHEFEADMTAALKQALARGDNSLLGGYLQALLSYPERIHEGLTVVHPRTQKTVVVGPALDLVTPKEEELQAIVMAELARGRKVLLYIQNSDTTDISPGLVEMMEKEGIRVKVLRSGDTENRARIIDNWVEKGLDVLITNPRKVEVGLDLLDFPSIVFYQVPLSTYTLRQASRRSWRIPQRKPVRVWFLTYAETMQTRLMKLMAEKLTSSLALEGELTDKGLAALSESSDTLAQELARMLVDKSTEEGSIKDIWADYRRHEARSETILATPLGQPAPELERVPVKNPEPDRLPVGVGSVSVELDRIGGTMIKVQFVEYIGKRKKKVTHIEVRKEDLDKMIQQAEGEVQAQLCLF